MEGLLQNRCTSAGHAQLPPPMTFSTMQWGREPLITTPSRFMSVLLPVSHKVVQKQLNVPANT